MFSFSSIVEGVVLNLPDAVSPLLVEVRVGEDSVHDPGAVGRRVADHRPHDQRHLALHVVHVGGVVGHHRQVPAPLVVQPEVLAERLGAEQLEALGHEESDGPGVSVEAARGEALVGAVKEGEELVGAADVRDPLPLLLGGVHTRGVVRARVQDDDGLGGGRAQVRAPALEVEVLVVCVPVAVGLDG